MGYQQWYAEHMFARSKTPAVEPAHQSAVKPRPKIERHVPFTSRTKRGLPRSGANVGSIRSQPGER